MPRLRRPRFPGLAAQGNGRNRDQPRRHCRNLRHRLLLAPALLYEYVWLPHHPRPRRCRGHGRESGQPEAHRMANLGRRRRARHRRQPFHTRFAPEHQLKYDFAQQPYLRAHQGPVLAHLAPRIRQQVFALRHGGRPVPPCGTGLRRTRTIFCTLRGHRRAGQCGSSHGRRAAQGSLRGRGAAELCHFQQRRLRQHLHQRGRTLSIWSRANR